MYKGVNRALGRYSVGGTVISDAGSGNIAAGIVVLQSGQSGLLVNFGGTVTYRTGDSIVLLLSDTDSLINERGSLKLKVSPGFVKPAPAATERVVIPAVKTLREVRTALELLPGDAGNIEATLIRVMQAAAAPDFFSGGHPLTDGSDTLELYTREEALFATAVIPPGPQNWIGYTGSFNGAQQFYIRNTDDVSGFVPAVPFTLLFGFAGVSDKTGAVDPTPLQAAANLVVTPFKAVGVGDHSTANGRFSFTGWPTGAVNGSDIFSGVVHEGRYYEVTIAPAAGFAMHLFRMTFTIRRSGTGVRQLVIRSSLDGFKANLAVSVLSDNTNVRITPAGVLQVNDASTADNEGCTVTMGTEFTNLDKPVTVRFYGFNSEAAGGTFSLDDVKITGSTR